MERDEVSGRVRENGAKAAFCVKPIVSHPATIPKHPEGFLHAGDHLPSLRKPHPEIGDDRPTLRKVLPEIGEDHPKPRKPLREMRKTIPSVGSRPRKSESPFRSVGRSSVKSGRLSEGSGACP